eukprot:4004369-Alexandrium_andersonii.AAC.1
MYYDVPRRTATTYDVQGRAGKYNCKSGRATTRCDVLRCTEMCCDVLRRITTHYDGLQRAA